MSSEPLPPVNLESAPRARAAVRPWLIAAVVGVAALIAWLAWPSEPETNAYDLSRADGRSRFFATTYPKMRTPPNLPIRQRLMSALVEFRRRYGKKNPAAYTFPPSPVQACSVHGMLNQCMELTGTQYFIAVEIAGTVEFGSSNALTGPQWVAAFEHAIETNNPVICYDYGKKRNFQDSLLLIRETPGVVKVVPRTKLAGYQKAGLVKASYP